MSNLFRRKRLAIITMVYWFLLLYILAALIFWFIELQKQNRQMTAFRLGQLTTTAPDFEQSRQNVVKEEKRKTAQYLGEGITFLMLIIVGAVFVYRATRRQIYLTQQQQNFMMAVTHELKTPIAVTKLNLETLRKRKLDEEKQDKLIQNTIQEANRLNDLCDNILVASQLETGGYPIMRDELDFNSLVQDSVQDFKTRFPSRKIDYQVMGEADMIGDSLLLSMMVNNLIENAIKYSPKEKPVSVRLKTENEGIDLEIIDEGPGIREEEKKKIFDKFYRVGRESNRQTKGTGLGLYLALKIARDHNGDITVTNNKPIGSNFRVHFEI
jgi:signal transduction histidine kinase